MLRLAVLCCPCLVKLQPSEGGGEAAGPWGTAVGGRGVEGPFTPGAPAPAARYSRVVELWSWSRGKGKLQEVSLLHALPPLLRLHALPPLLRLHTLPPLLRLHTLPPLLVATHGRGCDVAKTWR
jgi:hypothetical protein